MAILTPVYGYNGDPARCPGATEESLWAALGAGASGLVLRVALTEDGHVVCFEPGALTGGEDTPVNALTLEQLQKLDAGAHWTPPGLDSSPWAQTGRNRALQFITLQRALQMFGRRAQLIVEISEAPNADSLALATLQQLEQFGLNQRVPLLTALPRCLAIREANPSALLYALVLASENITDRFTADFKASGCRGLAAPQGVYQLALAALQAEPSASTANLEKYLIAKADVNDVTASGVISSDVLTTLDILRPHFCTFTDNFAGESINRAQWTAGYSHANSDTKIYQKDGVHIEIQAGGSYSGAAVVTVIPIHGDFDASVEYQVASPHQGTTFEMAAMGIDPGYYNIDNQHLTGTKVNLTFDVHGAPPYASSECDEDDGHRLGWNNGFNLTKIGDVRVAGDKVSVDPWSASSVNMYNKYRRDVGKGAHAGSKGKLRLRRSGTIFTAYYQDESTPVWVCSGTALLQNLRDDVFIRLAAKHWKKKNPAPPGNHVTFYNFYLAQP